MNGKKEKERQRLLKARKDLKQKKKALTCIKKNLKRGVGKKVFSTEFTLGKQRVVFQNHKPWGEKGPCVRDLPTQEPPQRFGGGTKL